jgi:hypothetical protein
MCDWSNWRFICEGRYDILLAILTGIALFAAVVMMLRSYYGKRDGVRSLPNRSFRSQRADLSHLERESATASERNRPGK